MERTCTPTRDKTIQLHNSKSQPHRISLKWTPICLNKWERNLCKTCSPLILQWIGKRNSLYHLLMSYLDLSRIIPLFFRIRKKHWYRRYSNLKTCGSNIHNIPLVWVLGHLQSFFHQSDNKNGGQSSLYDHSSSNGPAPPLNWPNNKKGIYILK